MFLGSPAATPQISLLLFPLGRVGVGWLSQHSVPACWGFEATQLLGVWAVPPRTQACPRVASQEAYVGLARSWGAWACAPALHLLCRAWVCTSSKRDVRTGTRSVPQCRPGVGPGGRKVSLHTSHTARVGPRDPPHATRSPLLRPDAGEGLSPSRGSCSDIPGMASGVAGETGFWAG